MAPTTSSGYTTPGGELESVLPLHPTAARRPHQVVVDSENAKFSDDFITSKYTDRGADVVSINGRYIVKPMVMSYEFQTQRRVSRIGYAPHIPIYAIGFELISFVLSSRLMMIGTGGNNGTTLAATILANRHNIVWHTKSGIQQLITSDPSSYLYHPFGG